GVVQSVASTRDAITAARELGLAVHVDGARVWNAAVALGVAPSRLLAGADTAMVTLSKGLCAPAGSLLLGSRARIAEARRVRKQLGGGMRQIGVLAAAGLVALDRMIPRLAEDHENARALADALGGLRGAQLAPVATNIVVATLDERRAPEAASLVETRGVRVSAMDARTLRLLTPHRASRPDCLQAP